MIERDDPQDKELAALYREASRDEPPAGLDARILAAARSTAAAPKPAAASWTNRWRVPIALAAIVVLSTTVTVLVQDEEAGRLEAPQVKRAAPPAPAGTATQTAPAPASAPPAAAEKHAEPRRKEARRESETRAQDAAPQPAREEAAPLLREEAAAAKAEAPAPDLSRSRGSVSGENKAAAGAPAAEALRSAPAPAPAPAAAAPASPAAAAPARRADSAERAAPAERAPRTPAQWIADIRRLRSEGKAAEAEASLAEFRKLYPWYALPDDLKQP